MDYLTIVQTAMNRAKAREGAPSSISGAVGLGSDFANWVGDAWRDLQESDTDWWFRQKLDQTLAITAGTDAYAMPSGLETLNYRTISVYTVAGEDEYRINFVRYEDWRMNKDTLNSGTGRPALITERPDGVIQLWPEPDQDYTLRFDGVWEVDAMVDDADTPGSNVTGGTTLPDTYHWILVWDAVRRYAQAHSDTDKLVVAEGNFLAQRNRLVERQTPPPYVPMGTLTGMSNTNRRVNF